MTAATAEDITPTARSTAGEVIAWKAREVARRTSELTMVSA